ncbi:hypothetical protein GCM10011511_22600 [Puia dinghuensis]|uniref:Uncharacterized protein n=2 Tax=Puia dinghuensis TaxID=1792502 RepID=A0A8J2UCM2_9BACT|nr:hypothetical protein [Puia dinghuensis]GGA98756.1 hypothetical protein GCM10011511_22600 [Puia dinghuensis]
MYSYLGTDNGWNYYNLGFGDFDPLEKKISDLTVSNNLDRDKILATVAATALEFSKWHPSCKIVIKGSTPARTRLYQMKICSHYSNIIELFDIQGLTKEGELVPFREGENFDGFIIERKS